ncbi:MAG: hypothetical protein ACRD0P_03175 [Stackebrandtia sp.]
MGAVTEWIDTLEFVAESPDGTVRSRACGREPLTVKLSPSGVEQHSEFSLAEQVAIAAREALLAYKDAFDRRLYGDRDPVELAEAGDDFAKRQLELHDAVADVTGVGVSPARYVDVEWHGVAGIRFRIQAGTIPRLRRAQLTAEINSGITAAERDRGRRIIRASEQVFGPIPFPPYKGVRRE